MRAASVWPISSASLVAQAASAGLSDLDNSTKILGQSCDKKVYIISKSIGGIRKRPLVFSQLLIRLSRVWPPGKKQSSSLSSHPTNSVRQKGQKDG